MKIPGFSASDHARVVLERSITAGVAKGLEGDKMRAFVEKRGHPFRQGTPSEKAFLSQLRTAFRPVREKRTRKRKGRDLPGQLVAFGLPAEPITTEATQ